MTTSFFCVWRSSGWDDGVWEHDKYEELIKVDPPENETEDVKTETETNETQQLSEQ